MIKKSGSVQKRKITEAQSWSELLSATDGCLDPDVIKSLELVEQIHRSRPAPQIYHSYEGATDACTK